MNKSLRADSFHFGCSQRVVQGGEGVKVPPKPAGRAAVSAGTPPGPEYKHSWCCPGREGRVEGSCWKRQGDIVHPGLFPRHITVAGFFMILTQWGSLSSGRLPTHALLNGKVLPQGQKGTSGIYGAARREECELWRQQTRPTFWLRHFLCDLKQVD